jgi:hypothetical protein
MSVSFKAPMALGFLLAIPLFALPAQGSPAYDTGHKPPQQRVADFVDARAYVGPVKPAAQAPETDGLSRKDEECNFGCVDH